MRAREEWHNADKLNSEAATKILSIRNSDNDISRLDLHGLHAAEAVQALQEHLHRIESQGFSKSSAPSNNAKKNDDAHSTLGSLNLMDWENLDKQVPLRLRSLALHVITGILLSFLIMHNSMYILYLYLYSEFHLWRIAF